VNGSVRTATILVTPHRLVNLELVPPVVTGGAFGRATITLSNAAPAGGTPINLLTDQPPLANIPRQITVAEGKTSVAFTFRTVGVSSARTLNLTAIYGTDRRSATMRVNPAVLLRLEATPLITAGGNAINARVFLTGEATGSGKIVTLRSNNSAARVPSTVRIAPGISFANFVVTTVPTRTSQLVTLSAVLDGRTVTLRIRVQPPVMSAFGVTPGRVRGGQPATGRINLDGPAPSGGIVVTLASDMPAVASVPRSLTIPAGARYGLFSIRTFATNLNRRVTITARYGTSRTSFLEVLR
jgi:hypothetical protein